VFDINKVIVRLASKKDVDSITEIYNETISEGIASFDKPPISRARYEAYFSEDRKSSCLIVAEINDLIIGWASIDPISERWAYRFTCLGSTYVRKDYRNNKVGTLLKQQKFMEAKKLGYHSIIGEVLSINRKSLSFQLSFGYRIVGEIHEAGYRDDKWIGLIVIQKML
jgi:phosphinothricin acetyltransferase